MNKLIELIEKHRDKWKKKWSKSTQLRDSNSEHYDQFLHGESVGATKAYNNVLQWMKYLSIMSKEKDLALTWEDVEKLVDLYEDVYCDFSCDGRGGYTNTKEHYEEVLRRFQESKNK